MAKNKFLDILRELQKITPPSGVLISRPQAQISIATAARPHDPDVVSMPGSPGYDVISIFNDVERQSPKLWLVNDGPGTLFAICSPDGIKWSGECDIFQNEFRIFTGVWELRVRSPDASNKYRVSEFAVGKLV